MGDGGRFENCFEKQSTVQSNLGQMPVLDPNKRPHHVDYPQLRVCIHWLSNTFPASTNSMDHWTLQPVRHDSLLKTIFILRVSQEMALQGPTVPQACQ